MQQRQQPKRIQAHNQIKSTQDIKDNNQDKFESPLALVFGASLV